MSAEVVFGGTKRKDRKARYKKKFTEALRTYKNILIVSVDNVGSNQMQKVRIALRGKAELLMGKNTVMRKVIRDEIENNPKLEALIPHLIGNIGFVMSNESMADIRKLVLENKVPAAAKSGATAPVNVIVPAGPTGLDPGQTSFFQALNIGTKIARGSIEIVADVQLLNVGDIVTSSHVALLAKMGMKPFFYGFVALTVYEDGNLYEAAVLDLDDDELKKRFINGITRVAALSLALGYPTKASIPHSVRNAFRRLLAIVDQTGYEFPQSVAIMGSKKKSASSSGSDSGSGSGSGSSSGSDSGSDSD